MGHRTLEGRRGWRWNFTAQTLLFFHVLCIVSVWCLLRICDERRVNLWLLAFSGPVSDGERGREINKKACSVPTPTLTVHRLHATRAEFGQNVPYRVHIFVLFICALHCNTTTKQYSTPLSSTFRTKLETILSRKER